MGSVSHLGITMSLILLEEEFPQNFVLSFVGWHPEICTITWVLPPTEFCDFVKSDSDHTTQSVKMCSILFKQKFIF